MFKNLNFLNPFKSLTVKGLGDTPTPTAHFGLTDNRWSEVERFANGLPWDFPMGQLTAQDVNDAKGDRTSLLAQLDNWREYAKTQEQNLETFAEVQAQRLGLAKSVLSARFTEAQTDAKLNDAIYKHGSQMGILQQKNFNARELAELQMSLGVKLENHKHNNNRDFEQAQFGEQGQLESTRLETRKTSLVDRYRQQREQAKNPTQREETYTPTSGRVLRFGRRAV
jgi:hypothetical protein